jgi:hypothetical protein
LAAALRGREHFLDVMVDWQFVVGDFASRVHERRFLSARRETRTPNHFIKSWPLNCNCPR